MPRVCASPKARYVIVVVRSSQRPFKFALCYQSHVLVEENENLPSNTDQGALKNVQVPVVSYQ